MLCENDIAQQNQYYSDYIGFQNLKTLLGKVSKM